MIEEPPKLIIKMPFRRPTTIQTFAFRNVPTGFVADALDGSGALHQTIKPLGEGVDIPCVVAGPALTVNTGPADILALLAALKYIEPGDVVVSAFGAYQGCAACGDRVAGMISNNGAAGLVIDGPIRDYAGMVKVGLPAWCTGINPNSPVAQGPGTIGQAIQIGGMEVETGDMIVADRDGVVVVPFEKIDHVIERLERIKKLEEELDKQVADGLRQPADIAKLLESDQVQFIE